VVILALGIVALSVAAMGMFNTLTVSLLERTHEVGLMKTMGMKSNEIENLFLVESVVMGMMGGIAGLIFGFAGGKLAGLVLTLLALRSGIGVVDIAYIPPDLIFYIVLLSLFVGFVTGIYPAQRAKYISALNALHYE
jgi:putative ABC transport system permease protein